MNRRKSTTKLHVNFQKDIVLAALGTVGIITCREAGILEKYVYTIPMIITLWGFIGMWYNGMLIDKAEERLRKERNKTIR